MVQSKALILLHGRGSTAQDILGLVDHIADHSFFVIAPQAPNNTWYPYSFMEEEKKNEPWLSSSIEIVCEAIESAATRVPKEKIYIVGFSQGACLALEVSARYAVKYGGVVAFTGGLIGKTIDRSMYKGNFEGTKVFIGTSDVDPHVPLERAQASRDVLESMGANVSLKVYPGMGHTINGDELQEARKVIFA